MKKVTLLCGMLLALTAGVAAAAPGVNIRWNLCYGDGGVINKNYVCNSNSGTNVAVGSFELGADIAQASGNEIVIDIATAGPVPAWWQFKNVGTCRSTSLGLNGINPAAVNCPDWASGQSAGGIGAYNIGIAGPNTARIVAALAVPASALADLFAGQEYFSYNMTINNAKTVGTGSCAGCSVGACIVFNSVKVTTQIAANDRVLSGSANGADSDFCTWQGSIGVTSPRGSGCGGATPTRNATWGAVKSLYR